MCCPRRCTGPEHVAPRAAYAHCTGGHYSGQPMQFTKEVVHISVRCQTATRRVARIKKVASRAFARKPHQSFWVDCALRHETFLSLWESPTSQTVWDAPCSDPKLFAHVCKKSRNLEKSTPRPNILGISRCCAYTFGALGSQTFRVGTRDARRPKLSLDARLAKIGGAPKRLGNSRSCAYFCEVPPKHQTF